ncbi:response regulator [Paenibacillus luteus]|uniref:response regulator n=1 Tax=Paenibacillus luteus TaxID=2545753 RepID=UPI00137609D9|nr:response regulator [Paenibacillus luteus]
MKLLIVDDEEHLVDSMIASIPWQEAGITACFAAYSGKQALEIIQTETVDIVITDVRMPGITGIDLIKAIKSQWPHISCMLLTGHAEFEYAQEGLKHKASHYLLKPVKDSELLAAVNETANARREEQEQARAFVHSQALVHRNLPALRANLLNNLIRGQTIPKGKLAEQLGLYNIPILYDDQVSLILVRIHDVYLRYQPSDMPILGFAVANIVEELLSESGNIWSSEDLYGNLVFVIRRDTGDITDQGIELLVDEMRRVVSELLHLAITVVLSPIETLAGGLEELYQRCIATMRLQVGHEHDLVVRLGGEHRRWVSHVVGSLYSPPLFQHLMEAGNWSGAKEKLEEIVEEWKSKYNGSNEHLSEIYYSLKSAYSYFVHKNGKLLADYRLHRTTEMKTIEELAYWAADIMERLQNELNSEMSANRHTLVAQIHQFLQERLSEDVSLQAIADYVYMHPTHVSKVFKRETGETISDYLLRLRMNNAVVLLKDSRYKIYEIASHLGYKNPTYFIKVFKERFGVTPQEFRDGS